MQHAGRPAKRADVSVVITVTLCWLALIAVWGSSERWDLPELARRIVRGIRDLHLAGDHHPLQRARHLIR